MNETASERNVDFAPLIGDDAGARLARTRAPDAKFWLGVAVAALLHCLLLIRAGTSEPTSLGAAGGAEDSISIDLVTQADLDGTATVEERMAGRPDVPPTAEPPKDDPPAQPAPEAAAQPPPEKAEPTQEKAAETPVEPKPETEPETKPETPADTKADEKATSLADLTNELPDLQSIPLPGEAPPKKPAADRQEKPKVKPPQTTPEKTQERPKEKKTARLDLSPPSRAFAPSGGAGGSAGFERPAGVTRSGANDAFGKGVITALQKSMPPHSGINGSVQVRIVLKPDGNVAEVKVLRPSHAGDIDDQVLFAARQTAYPFPPPNSKDVDRVFVVTYNYIGR